jgi:hypothetical protein
MAIYLRKFTTQKGLPIFNFDVKSRENPFAKSTTNSGQLREGAGQIEKSMIKVSTATRS